MIAVYLHMLTCASNASKRGRMEGWSDEDVATALDMEIDQVEAIREAMQGRVLDGDHLTGWEKRQPLREDEGAAARAKAWRESQKTSNERHQTQANATERNQTTEEIREEERIEEGKKHLAAPKYSALADLVSRGVDPQIANDWLAVRKIKKAPPTKTAIECVLRELWKAALTPADGIQLCCERGWAGFNPKWIAPEPGGRATTTSPQQLGKAGQATAAAAQRLIERMASEQAE